MKNDDDRISENINEFIWIMIDFDDIIDEVYTFSSSIESIRLGDDY